jgi:hypothetical protein
MVSQYVSKYPRESSELLTADMFFPDCLLYFFAIDSGITDEVSTIREKGDAI